MFNFRCPNLTCEGHEKLVPWHKKISHVYKNGERILREPILHCEFCKAQLEYVAKKFTGVPCYNKFPGLSGEEKKRILKKRASDHYKTKGKEEKRERFKTAMKKMKDE